MGDTSGRDLNRALTTMMGVGVAAFAALSGAVTIAYIVGYLNRRLYLSVFGASWMLSELNTTEVLIASYPAIAMLVVSLGLGFQGVTSERPAWAKTSVVNVAYVFGAAELLLDFLCGDRLLHETRAFLHGGIAGTLTFIAVALSRIGFVSLLDRSPSSRYSAVSSFALATIAGLVLAPMAIGTAEAHSVYADKFKNLPAVSVATHIASERLTLLAISDERVYCLKTIGSDVVSVLPVAWEHVVAIDKERR